MYSLLLHGKGLGEFQKWRHLSFVLQNGSVFSNSYSSASAADVSPRDSQKGKNFTVSYLIDSLGLAKKLSESISREVSFEEAYKNCKYKNLCQFLPEGSKQDNKIRNVSVLRELGVPQRLLFSLLISDAQPVCGKEKFEESLKKVVEKGFDPTTSKFVQALKVVYRTSDKTIEEKINVYKRFGFTVEDVWTVFKKWPMFLNNLEKKICQRFETLKKCGLLEDEVLSVFKKFPQCIGLSEKKIANSIETFIGLGFSRDEFAMMVKFFPLRLSAESVKKKTEFVVKKMNWPLKAVVSNPVVLGYSLEKRTVPRCNVIKALMSKGLLGSELPPMSSVLKCNDQVFLNRYVVKHDDKQLVPELMAIFTRDRASSRS